MNRILILFAAALLTVVTVGSTCFATDLETIRFRITGPEHDNRVQIALERTGRDGHHNDMSHSEDLSVLQGLDAAALGSSQDAPIRFAIVRDAGRVDCTGTARNHRADGTCDFTPSAAFNATLASKGYPTLDTDQRFVLTMTGFDPGVVDALRAAQYRRPDGDGVVSLGIFDIDAAYVHDMAGAGYRLGTVDDLVQFKIAHVTPALISAYRSLGYRDLSADDLTAMGIQGVTPEFIRGFARAGIRDIPADKLVELKIFDIKPEEVRAIQREDGNTSVDSLVRHRILQ